MPHDVDARLQMTAELVEVDLGYGDQMHETAAAFTREVLAVLDEHGGSYDGWSGFLVTGDPPDAPGA
jgi:hypothetical protein